MGNEPAEKGLQILLHIGIGIFLNDERTGCVLAEQGQQAVARPCYKLRDIPRKFVETGTPALYHELGLHAFRIPRPLRRINRGVNLQDDGVSLSLYPEVSGN